MKAKVLFVICASFVWMSNVYADNTITIGNDGIVTVPKGGLATVDISFSFDIAYQGFQLSLDLTGTDGKVSTVLAEGKPQSTLGFTGTDHTISSSLTGSTSNFICVSMSNAYIPVSGNLISIPVVAASDAEIGTEYTVTLKDLEFGIKGGTPYKPSAINFKIKVGAYVMDETSTTAPVPASGVNVTVKRTINANEWSTICLPFAMSAEQVKTAFGDDVELKDFIGYETTKEGGEIVSIKVNFSAATAIEANHPYIIKVRSAISEFSVNGVDIAPEEEPTKAAVTRTKKQWSEMIGTYQANTTVPDACLFLSGNEFYYSNGSTKMKAFRAYFDFYDELDDKSAASRAIGFGDDTTGILSVDLRNSNEDVYYDLNGRRVEKPAKGVYIINGKKVIIK